MEVNEDEKIVIAKPVPSRPGGSNFKSFPELLAGAINATPSNTCYETPVTAIRPRTVRFKPTANNALIGVVSSESKPLRNLVHYPSEEVLKSEKTSNVVYKPMAKLVSKTTVTLLANLRSTELIQEQALAQAERRVQRENLVKNQSGLRPESRNNLLFESGKEKKVESSKTSSAATLDEDQRSLSHSTISDRPSYDGYNWRKYGQKLVKGSEFPRSYYKCTHPNCPVKKKVERSLDGQIAEIVYKGEHSHPKPQPIKRNSSDGHCQGNVGNDSNNPLRSNQPSDRNEGRVGTSENRNEYGFSAHSSYSSRVPSFIDPITTRASNVGMSTLDIYSGHSGDFEDRRSKGPEAESYEPKSKRRKSENHSSEVGTSGEGTQEPLVIVQNPVDSEIIRDGFRWRKYGQKVVKGNQYPRSYYRCTSLKCNVRKYVERTSDDDPNAFITTYEGKHNHEMPIKSTHSGGAKTSSKADDIS